MATDMQQRAAVAAFIVEIAQDRGISAHTLASDLYALVKSYYPRLFTSEEAFAKMLSMQAAKLLEQAKGAVVLPRFADDVQGFFASNGLPELPPPQRG